MNRNLKHLFFLMVMACSISSYAQIQSINLSTGKISSNFYGQEGDPDQFWTSVTLPSGTVQHPRVHMDNDWAESGCSHWIAPQDGVGLIRPLVAGTYTYRRSFTISTSRIDCAKLVINAIGADNKVTGLSINGYNYMPVMPAGNNHFNPLTTNQTLFINPAHLVNGTNTITISTYNDWGPDNSNTMTGLNFCGSVVLNDPDFGIHPDVTGPTAICQGSPLTFGAGLAPGSNLPTHYFWRIYECDAAGNITSGGLYWESLWFTGVPSGTYTFPSNLNVVCGKYYMAVLSAVRESACSNWSQDIHVFNYTCKPLANAGPDQTICEGTCAIIGTTILTKGVSYSWAANGVSVGAGGSLSVCPTTTTTYTVTATNNLTGCSATDQAVITVSPNNPNFLIGLDPTLSPNYVKATATPAVMNANTVPGFAQYWNVEELDANNNSIYTIQNPNVWSPYPANCVFPGFDPVAQNYTGIVTTLPSSPSYGRFYYGHTYRITRGTRNNNCDWNLMGYLLVPIKSANGDGFEIIETKGAVSELFLQPKTGVWQINPNPSKGIFNIISEFQDTQSAVVEVFDMSGKKIETRSIEAGTKSLSLDLTGNAKGIYILNITTDGVSTIHKITID